MDEVILSRIRKEAYEQGFVDGKVEGYNLAAKHISPQRKKGRWVKVGTAMYRCSECGKVVVADDANELNYCSNCGFLMHQMTGGEE